MIRFSWIVIASLIVGLEHLPGIHLSAVEATAAEPLNFGRDEAIHFATQNNRELAIAELVIARAKADLEWSGRWDNPEIELSLSDDSVGLGDNEGAVGVAFSQRFPLTSRLKHEKKLRTSQVLLAEAEIAEQRRELAGLVDLAVVDLLATGQAIETQRGLLEINARILGFLEDQAAQGVVSRLDVNQAKLSGRTLTQEVDRLEAERKRQELALKELLGVEPDIAVVVSEPLRLPESLPKAGRSQEQLALGRPDFLLATARLDEAKVALDLERARRWEDVAVGAFVEWERAVDEPEGLERNTFVGIGISIPLPLRQRNQAGIDKALIDQEGAEKGLTAVRYYIRSEYERAIQHREALWKLALDASGEVLQLADENVEDFEKAQREGQASLLQVQRAQEQQLELRIAAREAVADYFRADARVRFVSGGYPKLGTRILESDRKEIFQEQ